MNFFARSKTDVRAIGMIFFECIARLRYDATNVGEISVY